MTLDVALPLAAPTTSAAPPAPRLGIVRQPLRYADLQTYDAIIDTRSPAEFALDHVPGAISCPVLDNDERVIVGTLYKQTSRFDAKKVGAALVAKNIARHIETQFHDKPKSWRPLIYCWRGGARSGAMTHILRQIGWDAGQLEGGYKQWRAMLVRDLATLAGQFQFIVICGKTGSGKSRLLEALTSCNGANTAQVLDLELLAAHKGSVLGDLPDQPQPSQKMFESQIWAALASFDSARPVFVEAESKKVGKLQVPDALIQAMWQGKCIILESDDKLRVPLLREEYAHLIANPQLLNFKLDCLRDLHANEKIAAWHDAVSAQNWDDLVHDLLITHYDPAYTKSMFRNYQNLANATKISLASIDTAGFNLAAAAALRVAARVTT
jgi:tRNA 2-selenouridine synthase